LAKGGYTTRIPPLAKGGQGGFETSTTKEVAMKKSIITLYNNDPMGKR
jgi:hypothetical protein